MTRGDTDERSEGLVQHQDTQEVPPEFRQHRYMTSNAAANFLDQDWQHQEATRYATREFKRLLYFTAERPDKFYTDVVGSIEGFEQKLLTERDAFEKEAQELFEAGDDQAACNLITDEVEQWLLESLHFGMDLTKEIGAETRERFGIRKPDGRDEPGETVPSTSQPMAKGGGKEMVNCYDDDLHDDYPREHGVYTDNRPSD